MIERGCLMEPLLPHVSGIVMNSDTKENSDLSKRSYDFKFDSKIP